MMNVKCISKILLLLIITFLTISIEVFGLQLVPSNPSAPVLEGHARTVVNIYTEKYDPEKKKSYMRHVGTGAVLDVWHVLTAARICWVYHTNQEKDAILEFTGNSQNFSDLRTRRTGVEFVIPDVYIKSKKNYQGKLEELPRDDVCLIRVNEMIMIGERFGIYPIRLANNPTTEKDLQVGRNPTHFWCASVGYQQFYDLINLYSLFFSIPKHKFVPNVYRSHITTPYHGGKVAPAHIVFLADIGGLILCPQPGNHLTRRKPVFHEGYILVGIAVNGTLTPQRDDYLAAWPIQYSLDWIYEQVSNFYNRTTTTTMKPKKTTTTTTTTETSETSEITTATIESNEQISTDGNAQSTVPIESSEEKILLIASLFILLIVVFSMGLFIIYLIRKMGKLKQRKRKFKQSLYKMGGSFLRNQPQASRQQIKVMADTSTTPTPIAPGPTTTTATTTQ